MAAAETPLGQVLLVVILRLPKNGGGHDLGHNGAFVPGLLKFVLGGLGGFFLLGVVEENDRAVLGPDVRPLPVQAGGVVAVPKTIQELLIGNLFGVEFHLHHFRMARAVRTNVLISGGIGHPALVSHRGGNNTFQLPESFFDSPKTARSECGFFHFPLPFPVLRTADAGSYVILGSKAWKSTGWKAW